MSPPASPDGAPEDCNNCDSFEGAESGESSPREGEWGRFLQPLVQAKDLLVEGGGALVHVWDMRDLIEDLHFRQDSDDFEVTL